MRLALAVAVIAALLPSSLSGSETKVVSIEAHALASYIEACEKAGWGVRFVVPAASRTWEECPQYGCFPSAPGEPDICIDPPEPPEPIACITYSEVTAFTVVIQKAP